ncbi:CinA family protein [Paeniglutamicibacter sp. R2-26]|uniref:CinA family protein n=1 Tax=Paeniglutamicibacter sp. R2-26 TaxID=3144417 RepID=UPI003EE7C1F1
MDERTPEPAANPLAREAIADAIAAGLSLATAESLTAGMIAATLAEVPGASAVLLGGVVSYSSEVKANVLSVDRALLASAGSVDAEVARQMAVGARDCCHSDIAVSATGVAGPDAHDGKAVGTVFLGYAHPGGSGSVEYRFQGDRAGIRSAATDAAITLLISTIRSVTAQVDGAM